jgi:glycosyltransferase involved in cell wall biosynthesis
MRGEMAVKKQDVLVSIVTVCYNSEATIRDTLESVLHQTYQKIEYIIVDGASKDHTLEIVEEYRPQFEKRGIPYLVSSEKDHGVYDAMNKGIAKATGTLVGMINSDDWFEPNAVERVVDTFHKEDFDMFYADIRLLKGESQIIKKARYRKYATSRDWNHPTTFMRRTVYDKFQYATDCVYDDWDLMLKVFQGDYKVVVLNEVLANFRMGGLSNEGGVKTALRKCRERYHIYRRNGYSRLYLFECIATEMAKLVVK